MSTTAKIKDLTPYARNSRTHSDEQVSQIAASIREFGFTAPVLYADGTVIADNKLALNAGWDEDMLRLELGDLKDDGFDLDLTGFDAGELAALFDEAEAAEDEAGGGW